MTMDDLLGSDAFFLLAQSAPDQREFWDRWHEDHDHASDDRHAEEMRGEFLSELGEVPSARVLEVGCGQGRDAMFFGRAGLNVVALDHSSVALSRARAEYERARTTMPGDVTWLPCDYGESGLPKSKPFDAVYSHLSLHYFNDMATQYLFEKIKQALHLGGLLFFTVRSQRDPLFEKGYGLEGEQDYRCYRGHVRRFFSEEYLEKLLSDWSGVELDTYAPQDETNPGTFIRCKARRSDCEVL